MRSSRAASALVASFFVLVPAVARAAGELPLEWSAPEGCTTEPQMIAAVQERLADARPELTDLGVRGRVEREGSGWVAVLVLRDDQGSEMGERRVHESSADCHALEGPVSLVIAMMLKQHLTRADFFVPPPPEPPTPPAPPTSRLPTHAAETPPSNGLHISWTAALGCVVSVGILPAASVGVSGRIDNRIGDVFGVALEVAYQLTDSMAPFAAAPGTVSFSMLSAAAIVHLAVLRSDRLELGPTAVVRAGVVSARGTGFDFSQTDTSAMVTVGVGGLASIRLVSNLRLEIALEAAVPLVHDRYETAAAGETMAFQNSPIAGHFQAGLAWRLE